MLNQSILSFNRPASAIGIVDWMHINNELDEYLTLGSSYQWWDGVSHRSARNGREPDDGTSCATIAKRRVSSRLAVEYGRRRLRDR
jgi:hypothetical protein